jgi:hypothetical protein
MPGGFFEALFMPQKIFFSNQFFSLQLSKIEIEIANFLSLCTETVPFEKHNITLSSESFKLK